MSVGALLLIGVLYLIGVLIDLVINNNKDKRPKGFREG